MERRCISMVIFAVSIIFLQSSFTQAADANIKQVTDPTGNVNLSPFEQWISAYECLQNTSTSCPGKFQLTEGGWVNVTQKEGDDYCKPHGCFEHTQAVLMCVYLVKHDYVFNNSATVPDVNYTINNGCNKGGFTGQTIFLHSKAAKLHQGMSITFVSALAAWLVISFMTL